MGAVFPLTIGGLIGAVQGRRSFSGEQAQREIGIWMKYYIKDRPHSNFADDKIRLEGYAERMAT